jgi:hypothetical protein
VVIDLTQAVHTQDQTLMRTLKCLHSNRKMSQCFEFLDVTVISVLCVIILFPLLCRIVWIVALVTFDEELGKSLFYVCIALFS